MSSVPLHPALVHLPIGLALAVPIIAVTLTIAIRRGALPRKAWWGVVLVQGLVVLGGTAAFKAGEHDEERVARVVGKPLIEAHEERAEAFLWTAGATLGLAAIAVAAPAAFLGGAFATTVAGTIVTAALALYAGKAGGELVYHHGAAQAYGQQPTASAPIAHRGDR
jgi:hypothetical protein